MVKWLGPMMAAGIHGCCTEAGCFGSITILLDRSLSDDAVVSVEIDSQTLPCGTTEDFRECMLTEADGRRAIRVKTGMGEQPDAVVVSVSEGGVAADEYEVRPTWDDDAYYPNGKRCGAGCTSGTAELVLD